MEQQSAPCTYVREIAPIIAAVGAIITACFTAFLTHRRLRADDRTERHRLQAGARNESTRRTLVDIERKLDKCE